MSTIFGLNDSQHKSDSRLDYLQPEQCNRVEIGMS